ncbi:MAG: oxidoreductase, molybdopterin binding protein [Ktedonobacterales bacterium]|nr:MAG: oxidoreductase, molybdopterin binding protein [Ktedonobacterales bacterium]
MDLSRLFGQKQTSAPTEKRPDGRDRLPPGQYHTKKWPILSYEKTPRFDPTSYQFKVWGAVENPIQLTWDELLALPRTTLTTDFHCVTTWSRYDNEWEGVHIREILGRVKPTSEAHFVTAHSFTGYTTNMPLTALDDDDVMIVFRHDGQDLEPDHGGPVRLLVPKLYAYKSAKWLNGLEFMENDRPGFWEIRGYSNSADPWNEERYW